MTTYHWSVFPSGLITARHEPTGQVGIYRRHGDQLCLTAGEPVLPEWARLILVEEMQREDAGQITGGTVSLA